jgi:ribosomal 50S subunit-recycling heat shock protein
MIVLKAMRNARTARFLFDIPEDDMRLDKYLKVSRIIKRRTVANEVCDAGKAVVNGKVARASYDVKEGDVIELNFESRSVKFRVEKVAETVRKEDAASMYTPLN